MAKVVVTANRVRTLSVVLIRCGYWSMRNLTTSTFSYSTAVCRSDRPALSRAGHSIIYTRVAAAEANEKLQAFELAGFKKLL